jgi:hypothetical protein
MARAQRRRVATNTQHHRKHQHRPRPGRKPSIPRCQSKRSGSDPDVLEVQMLLETLGRSPDFLDGIPGAKRPRQSDRKQGDSNTQPPASGAAAAGAELTDFNARARPRNKISIWSNTNRARITRTYRPQCRARNHWIPAQRTSAVAPGFD